MKEYATKELRRLQQKYINEDGSQKRGMLAKGPDRHKHMTSDELFEDMNVLRAEPRIGRLANDRKKANELIAMPRGLLNVLLDELSFLIYCETAPRLDSQNRAVGGPAQRPDLESRGDSNLEHPEEVEGNAGDTADH